MLIQFPNLLYIQCTIHKNLLESSNIFVCIRTYRVWIIWNKLYNIARLVKDYFVVMSFLNSIYHNHLLSNRQIGQIHPVYKAAVSIHGAQYSLPIRCWFSRLKVARCRLPRTLVCRDVLVLASAMRGCVRRSSGSTWAERRSGCFLRKQPCGCN